MRITLLRLLPLLVALLVASTAAAQGFEDLTPADQDRLILLLSDGNAAFDRGDHAEACAAYQEAADLAEFPEVYYRLATCRERTDELPAAIAAYQTYLRLEPDAPDRQRIEREVQRLEELLDARSRSTIEITSEPDDARVLSHDGDLLGTTPLTLVLPPGEASFTLEHPGFHAASRSLTLEGGASRDLHIVLERVAPDAPGPAFGVVGWSSLAIGALAGGASGVFYFLAEERAETANNYIRNNIDNSRSELNSIENQARQLQDLTRYTGVLSAALIATGGTFLFLQSRRSRQANQPQLTLHLTPGETHAAFRLQF